MIKVAKSALTSWKMSQDGYGNPARERLYRRARKEKDRTGKQLDYYLKVYVGGRAQIRQNSTKQQAENEGDNKKVTDRYRPRWRQGMEAESG